ncbi:MAG TPA: D-tyrosyl-tRNA(Tyr) deacylase [Chromatiales bacterium]|nr:D-tyrosyl-tRNA(Tyr) deacylase [Chromatiales bacterium]
MIGLIQRVSRASVTVDGTCIAEIGPGLLALVAVQHNDAAAQAKRLAERLLSYRVFPDAAGRMNRSLTDTGGELLVVPQFTLAADTRRGNRPSFTSAAPPEHGERLFRELLRQLDARDANVKSGRFGADMTVSLVNEGPVTFWLETGSGAPGEPTD